jgi:hypothetical protein
MILIQIIMKRDRESDKYIVVSCFDKTGNMVKPWLEKGYECHIIDLQHEKGKTVEGNLIKWGYDVKEWEEIFFKEYFDKEKIIFASFFPPCTDLAVSGARWFEEKEKQNPGCRKRAMDLVHWSDECGKKLGCPYFIENPVSVISTEWRKPNFTFHPYEFGAYKDGENDGYTKKTCLWTNDKFKLPEKKPIECDPKIKNKIHFAPPSKDRQNIRSATPKGFAQAIFQMYSK